MNTLPSAIIKLSWKVDSLGNPRDGASAAIGGIASSAFTLSSGTVLTASHNFERLLSHPHTGFDNHAVWIAHPNGECHPLTEASVRHFTGFDIAALDCPPSVQPFVASETPYGDIQFGVCLGYRASTSPFRVVIKGKHLTISDLDLNSAVLPFPPTAVEHKMLHIRAADLAIDSKRGFLLKHPSTVGVSGGPMLDPADGSAIAVCCFGFPPDAHEKHAIGTVDLRDLPL